MQGHKRTEGTFRPAKPIICTSESNGLAELYPQQTPRACRKFFAALLGTNGAGRGSASPDVIAFEKKKAP